MRLLDLNICIKLNNTQEVIRFINKENIDICAIQEAMNGIDDSCFEMYKSKNELIKLKQYPYNAFAPLFIAKSIEARGKVIRDFGGSAEQGTLLLSKYNIKEHYNQFYYNEYKYSYDATNFHENDWCRSIQNSILDIDGKQLQIINVHGIWNEGKIGDNRTILQSEFIISKIRDDIACIVTGDFNLLPETKSIKMLDGKMRNLIKEYNIKTTRPEKKDSLVCDYIFVNDKVKVNDFKTMDSQVSDHLPLILDFDI